MHPNTVIVPTLIQELEGQGVIEDVVGGEHHTLVLMNDGRVFSFGRADLSQLGVWRNTIGGAPEIGHPQLITSVQNVVQISTCSNHNITTDHLGVAHTWGFGETYALGTGSEEDAEVPVMLTGQKLQGHRVLRVAAGAQHSVILARQ
ncbi:hypothetical protein DFQ29_001270 [Apophysomyces sp. BC1021]|nr:hypothetical protein DFQ29_001270 [Apophysomyces sp. BC1021]